MEVLRRARIELAFQGAPFRKAASTSNAEITHRKDAASCSNMWSLVCGAVGGVVAERPQVLIKVTWHNDKRARLLWLPGACLVRLTMRERPGRIRSRGT